MPAEKRGMKRRGRTAVPRCLLAWLLKQADAQRDELAHEPEDAVSARDSEPEQVIAPPEKKVSPNTVRAVAKEVRVPPSMVHSPKSLVSSQV